MSEITEDRTSLLSKALAVGPEGFPEAYALRYKKALAIFDALPEGSQSKLAQAQACNVLLALLQGGGGTHQPIINSLNPKTVLKPFVLC